MTEKLGDTHILVFFKRDYSFLCLPLLDSLNADYNENGAVLDYKEEDLNAEDPNEDQHKCTIVIDGITYTGITYYFKGSFSKVIDICGKINKPIVDLITDSKSAVRESWIRRMETFRSFNLDDDSVGKWT